MIIITRSAIFGAIFIIGVRLLYKEMNAFISFNRASYGQQAAAPRQTRLLIWQLIWRKTGVRTSRYRWPTFLFSTDTADVVKRTIRKLLSSPVLCSVQNTEKFDLWESRTDHFWNFDDRRDCLIKTSSCINVSASFVSEVITTERESYLLPAGDWFVFLPTSIRLNRGDGNISLVFRSPHCSIRWRQYQFVLGQQRRRKECKELKVIEQSFPPGVNRCDKKEESQSGILILLFSFDSWPCWSRRTSERGSRLLWKD